MKKRYFFSIIAIVVILLLVGCSSEIKDTNDDESSLPEDYSSLIEEATTVNVKERFVSLTKTYDVYVDGKEIGSVSGEYVNITGDIFTLTDANGNEIAKEKQIKRWGVRLNRLANLMDQDGNTTGYIGEEYFTDSGYYKYHEAYHLLKFSNEKQILEKAYNEYLDLKKSNLWGNKKYF